ncbi:MULTISPECIES: preprotein translocase subunit YajC [unclassified Thermotoga]|uniref:preprotein translocase subunit YajC n=1 Tax=unclassified Thermotoga TaxID=2631113 RepID=UPI000543095C|nr:MULTISPECIES: preprotein translocase subunit YajC [unclassified Thermotoga]KAF2959669.1 preprotein translocase subunit YajC [Thermotoga sp. 38H-to]KHC90695.1 preprotein translocase subunit YajC [Thermotoga sp. Mc24]
MPEIIYAAAPGASNGSTTTATGGWGSLLFMLIFFIAIFYFMIILPQRRREKQFQQMISQIKRGDTVVTIGGIVGKVIDIKKDTVKIKTANSTELEITKRAISTVIKERSQEDQEG